jgi:quinol monooxygenase YgiN
MNTPHSTIVVTGFVQVAAKDRDSFLDVLRAHVPRVRRKDGCIAYAFAVDALDPNLLRMSESWRDLAALNAHLADDEFKGTLASLAGLDITARSVQRHEVASTIEI